MLTETKCDDVGHVASVLLADVKVLRDNNDHSDNRKDEGENSGSVREGQSVGGRGGSSDGDPCTDLLTQTIS